MKPVADVAWHARRNVTHDNIRFSSSAPHPPYRLAFDTEVAIHNGVKLIVRVEVRSRASKP
jgi:hypothetical protein